MLRTLTLAAVLAGAGAVCAADGPDKGQAKAGAAPAAPAAPAALTVPVLRLAPCAKPTRALEYRLLPPPEDLTHGNAATLWLRAGMFVHTAKPPMTDREWSWLGRKETPLKDFPRKEVRDLLKRYEHGLRLADQAARRDRCDWDRPPLTFQRINDPNGLGLEEIQYVRHLAAVLSLRARLELSEGRFDQVAHTLQTGFGLARHLVGSDLIIQDLVGIAIGAIMLGHVEEWVQTSGSPNLYWSLTELPRPLFNVRPAIERELNTLYRSHPQLSEVRKGTLTPREMEKVFDESVGNLCKMLGSDVPAWATKLSGAALAVKHHTDAKKYLLAHGHKAAQVDAMSAAQAVLLYFLGQYEEARDDVLKWLSVQPWQAQPELEKLERRLRAAPPDGGGIILRLLLPAMTKVYAAQVRTERYVAGLRGAEALRLYAAAHGGKPPARWADISEVPLPTDPLTGKGLDALYRVQDGKGILDMPPPPPMPAIIGRRYELAPPS